MIPTKNRSEYTLNVVKQILGITHSGFELIIQDNSDNDELKTLLGDYLNDQRVKYYYSKEIRSFVSNFSIGIGNCTGEYVTIIGDDDGISPQIIEVADWASKNGIDAITPSLPAVYYWPHSGVNTKDDNGRLTMTQISCSVSAVNTNQELRQFFKNGCQNYLSYSLAKVYHGIVRKSILQKIKIQTGNYVGGLSPDIYLSVACSLLIEKVWIIDFPLTIAGICKKSGSSDSATGKHTGNLRDAPHFRGHANYVWSDRVPAFYSVETIWADSALAAINDLSVHKMNRHFNIDVLSGYCMKLYPSYSKEIVKNLSMHQSKSGNTLSVKLHLLKGQIEVEVRLFVSKVRNKIFNNKPVKEYKSIADICAASSLIQELIKEKTKKLFSNLPGYTHEVNYTKDITP